jgi:hypothetical protein
MLGLSVDVRRRENALKNALNCISLYVKQWARRYVPAIKIQMERRSCLLVLVCAGAAAFIFSEMRCKYSSQISAISSLYCAWSQTQSTELNDLKLLHVFLRHGFV